jgi:hypothetical protein
MYRWARTRPELRSVQPPIRRRWWKCFASVGSVTTICGGRREPIGRTTWKAQPGPRRRRAVDRIRQRVAHAAAGHRQRHRLGVHQSEIAGYCRVYVTMSVPVVAAICATGPSSPSATPPRAGSCIRSLTSYQTAPGRRRLVQHLGCSSPRPRILLGSYLFNTYWRGPLVLRLINTETPTARQRDPGKQTPAFVLHGSTRNAVLVHFRNKRVYFVAQEVEFMLQVVLAGWMYGNLRWR